MRGSSLACVLSLWWWWCVVQTLPVLAELLEDTDVAVESRAQQVLALLEEVGGEKLEPYLKA